MASKIKVMPQKEEMLEKGGPETQPDRPLLDLSAAAVKELIRNAKKRGYVSHGQIDASHRRNLPAARSAGCLLRE
jgi:RNA polymerase primary sigma factor